MPSVVRVRASSRSGAARARGGGSAGEVRLVVLDDGRSFRVDAEAMARWGVALGETIAEELLADLQSRDAYLRAREIAVRLLALRPRSTTELQHRLRQHRVPDEQAREVLADLTTAGYLDDLAFARGWVAGRIASRPCGFHRLRGELREKGVASGVIEQAIREALGEEDLATAEERYARAIIARRSARDSRLPLEARRRRIAAFLERRGFASATIARVLRIAGRTGLAEDSTGYMDG